MKRVLKWNIPVDDRNHTIGAGPVVHVACQAVADVVQVWTEEIGENIATPRYVRVFGTGQPLPLDTLRHLGSAVTAGGHLVWHLYEVKP